MPYIREGKCVYEKNPDGSKGKNRGCSETEEMAKAHMRALYAHHSDKEMMTPKEFAEAYEIAEKDFSYAQSETWVVSDAASAFSYLMSVARQEMYSAESDDAKEIIGMMQNLLKFMSNQMNEMSAAIDTPVKVETLTEYAFKETLSKMLTTKEGEKYRWTLITGSAFEDKDGEIIATKAFEDDCDRMEYAGDYGELLWWHCDGLMHGKEKESRPYIPLGRCDLSLVYEKLNIESGTYYDNEVGAVFNERAKEFGASKSFWYKPDEPVDGVYSYIRTRERSLLPRTKEANLLTRLFGGMKEKEMADNKDRIAALKEKLGEEKTNELLAQGKEMSEKAEKFLASKEQKEEPKPDVSKEMAELLTASKEAKEVTEALSVSFKELQTKLEEASKELAELKGLAEKEAKYDAQTKEDIAKLQGAVATLLGFQPKGANRFEASKEGKQPELTEEQKKMEKEADGQKTGFEGLTQWLITGERQAA